MEKTVGIVVCTYNKPQKLKNALDLIRKQTYNKFFVSVVDDCSTAKAENKSICKSFDGEINYLCNDENRGISYSRNIGLKYLMEAKPKPSFICMLDDDDYWPLDRLSRGISIMDNRIGMSYGIQHMTDDKLRPIIKYPCRVDINRIRAHALFFGEFFFPAKTYMFNTDFLNEISLKSQSWYYQFDSREDIELGIRALEYSSRSSYWKTVYCPHKLACWVQSRDLQKFRSDKYYLKQLECHKYLVKKYMPKYFQQIALKTAPYTFRLPQLLKFGLI